VKNEFDEWWEQQPESGTGGISTLNFLRVQFQALAFRAWLAGRSLLTLEEQRKVIGGNKMDLSKHEKYCRLSNTENKLCLRKSDDCHCNVSDRIYYLIHDAYEACMFPSKQQPVEIPKDDSLEELLDVYTQEMYGRFIDEMGEEEDVKKLLRELVEKVRAL